MDGSLAGIRKGIDRRDPKTALVIIKLDPQPLPWLFENEEKDCQQCAATSAPVQGREFLDELSTLPVGAGTVSFIAQQL